MVSRYSKFNDSDFQIYKLKIEILRQLEKYNEALELVQEAIDKLPKEPKLVPTNLLENDSLSLLSKEEKKRITYHYDFCIIKARILILMNKKEEALEVIESVIKSNPRLTEAYAIKTIILGSLEKYNEAISQIDKAIEIDPKKSNYYRIRSRTLHEQFREDEALDTINKAIELDQKNPTDYYLKAKILVNLDKPHEALETIDKRFDLFPDYLDFYEMRNLILYILGRYDEALIGIKEALNLGVKYRGIYYEKGQVLETLNQYDVALNTINKVLEVHPNDEHTINLKILVLIDLEKCDEALEVLEHNKEIIHRNDIKSDSYNNLKAQIFYTRAKLFAKTNMREDAINAIETAFKLSASNRAEYTYKYGEIMMFLHDYKAALEKFESALTLPSPPLDIQIKLGKCYFEIGQYDNALKHLEIGKYQAESKIIKIEDGKRVKNYYSRGKMIKEAEQTIDEIYSLLLKLKPTSLKTEIYFNIGDSYVSRGIYDLAMKYFQQGREFAIKRKENNLVKRADHEIRRFNIFIEGFKLDALR